MKLDFNRKYNTIAVYTILVVAISAVAVVAIMNHKGLLSFFSYFFTLLTPFIIGFVIAYLINPILNTIEKRAVKPLLSRWLSLKTIRLLSMALTYICSVIIVTVFFRIVIPQIATSIAHLAAQIPGWIYKAENMISTLMEKYDLYNLEPQALDQVMNALKQVVNSAYDIVKGTLPHLLQATLTVTTGLLNFVVGIIISAYILSSKERLCAQSKKLLTALMPRNVVTKVVDITHQSHMIFSGFISGKILDSFIIGILCFIGMWIFRFPYPMLISVIVGVTNIIPYFGPFIGAVPAVIIMLIADPVKAIWLVLFILALQQLDGNFIGPWILGDSTGLSALWVIFSITVFGSLLGFVGMFVGVPLFAVIYSLIRQFSEWRLKNKNLPTATTEYASDNAILLEDGRKRKRKKEAKKETDKKNK